jgi:predicted HTH transcriptional regulator
MRRRLPAWRWRCTHRELLDGPPPSSGQAVSLNDRQLTALELAKEQGRVTNGDLQERFCYHPETLRQDLAWLVERGYLETAGSHAARSTPPGGWARQERAGSDN